MADTKLSDLSEVTTLADTDELYVNDGGTSKRVTKANLLKSANVSVADSGGNYTGTDVEAVLAEIATDTANGINFKNKIINGDFRIWQRGDGTVTDTYSADRWFINGTTTGSQADLSTLGFQTPYGMELATGAQAMQGVELTQTGKTHPFIDGAQYTMSVWSSGTVSLYACFEAEVSGSGAGVILNITPMVATGRTEGTLDEYSLTFTYSDANIAGTDKLARFQIVNTQGAQIVITQVQLEKGSVATDFEQRPQTVEEQLCKRYTRRLDGGLATYAPIGVAFTSTSTAALIEELFDVEMRATPTVAFSGNFRLRTGSAGAQSVTDITGNVLTSKGCQLSITSASLTAGEAVFLEHNNDIDAYILFDAEL